MQKLYFLVQVTPWDPDEEENPQAPGHPYYVNGVPYASIEDFLKEVGGEVKRDIEGMNMGDVSWETAAVQITENTIMSALPGLFNG